MRKIILLIVMVVMNCVGVFGQAPSWEWARSAGGGVDDGARSVAVDANGNIYVAGYFVDSSITFGSITVPNHGAYDFFIVKYDSSGNVIWAQNSGGTGYVEGRDIAVDIYGNLYLTGSSFKDTIIFGNFILTNPDLYGDVFVVKYDSSGNVKWAKSTSGSDTDIGVRIKTDALGNVYINGVFESPVIDFGGITLPNASSNGDGDPFIAKYDSSGNVLWAKSGTGILIDGSADISVDENGNSYIIGSYISPTITFDGITLTNNSTSFYTDVFIVKYNPFGNVIWAKNFGSTDIEGFGNIVHGLNGNSYVSGYFQSPSITFDTITIINSNPGSKESFIVKLDSSGNAIRTMIIGTPSNQSVMSLETGVNGDLYIAGFFTSATLNFGSITLTNANAFGDFFIAKYDATENLIWAKGAGGNKSDIAYDIAVDINSDVYITGDFSSTLLSFGTVTLNNTGLGTRDFFIAKLDSTIIIGLDDFNNSSLLFNIYPNPTTSQINISSSFTIDKIEIADIMGQVVYSATPHQKNVVVQMEHAGIYFVLLTCNNQTVTKKLVVQK